jgi:hypothetical protein
MDFENYWSVPSLRDATHDPVTDEQIDAAEHSLGVRLPQAYVSLIRCQNGGYLRGQVPRAPGNAVWGIGESRVPGPQSITTRAPWNWEDYPADSCPPDKALLVRFDSGGHWDICLDYRRSGPTGTPGVSLVRGSRVKSIASSFEKYLSSLKVPRVPGRRVYGPGSFDEVVAKLREALADAPVNSDTHYDYGYRTVTLQLPGEHEWVWICSNRCPIWWKRQPDGTTILSEKTALRLPEEPGCVAFLSTTNSPALTAARKRTDLITKR